MEKTQEVFEYSKELFSNWFSDGRGLRNYDLKNYTSGDHEEEGFEVITTKVMHKALTILLIVIILKILLELMMIKDWIIMFGLMIKLLL